jgi:hypothetical protein
MFNHLFYSQEKIKKYSLSMLKGDVYGKVCYAYI